MKSAAAAAGWLRAHGRALALCALVAEVPVLVLGDVSLPFGFSFGSRSFSRNVALVVALAAVAQARGMPRLRGYLSAPLLLLVAAAAASVAANAGAWGDTRSLAAMAALYWGARSLAHTGDGRSWLFHWLGALAVTTVALEVIENPSILQFREALRGTTVTGHPNTLGVLFALLGPLFLAHVGLRRGAAFYAACAILGAGFTFSRLAWSGLALGAITIAVLERPPGSRRTLIGAGLLAACATGAVVAWLSTTRTEADWQRLRIMWTSLTLFREHWLVGVGFGTANLGRLFPARYIELYGSGLFLFHSHNMYVDLLVGTGVLGGLAGAGLLARLAALALRGLDATRGGTEARRRVAGLAATVLVFFYVGLGDTPWYHPKVLFPLAILWALTEGSVAAAERARTSGEAQAPASPASKGVAKAVAICFMMSPIVA